MIVLLSSKIVISTYLIKIEIKLIRQSWLKIFIETNLIIWFQKKTKLSKSIKKSNNKRKRYLIKGFNKENNCKNLKMSAIKMYLEYNCLVLSNFNEWSAE
jgi:hypothetical protein